MACHDRYCASRSAGGMTTRGKTTATASTPTAIAPNRGRRGYKAANDNPASGKSLTAAPTVMLSAAPSWRGAEQDRKSTRLNSSHVRISYAVFCLKKKKLRLHLAALLKQVESWGQSIDTF